jgi:hypothetical protein
LFILLLLEMSGHGGNRICPDGVKKKADVVEHPQVFNHVGLLVNGPVAGATCPLSSRPNYKMSGAHMQQLRTHLNLGLAPP